MLLTFWGGGWREGGWHSNKTWSKCPLLGKLYTHNLVQTPRIFPKQSSLSRSRHFSPTTPTPKPLILFPLSCHGLPWPKLHSLQGKHRAGEEVGGGGHEGGGVGGWREWRSRVESKPLCKLTTGCKSVSLPLPLSASYTPTFFPLHFSLLYAFPPPPTTPSQDSCISVHSAYKRVRLNLTAWPPFSLTSEDE